MSRKRVSTTVYLDPEQDEKLKALSARSKVPIAVYIREGIDMMLDKRRTDRPARRLPAAAQVDGAGAPLRRASR